MVPFCPVNDIRTRHPGHISIDVLIAFAPEVVDHHSDQVDVLVGFGWISLHNNLHDVWFFIPLIREISKFAKKWQKKNLTGIGI